ncbi:MAG: PadR family transcriptional regulator [Terriglobales bacterium]
MDSPSSLELFLLAAIADGCATAYNLHREAGLSVGSTLPALQRMVKGGWLTVETTGGRGRMQHKLTATGRKQLGSWRQSVDEALESPASDIDARLRLIALVWHQGDKRRLKKLLSAFPSQPSDDSTAADSADTLPGFYRSLLRAQATERLRANARLIREISKGIKNF